MEKCRGDSLISANKTLMGRQRVPVCPSGSKRMVVVHNSFVQVSFKHSVTLHSTEIH